MLQQVQIKQAFLLLLMFCLCGAVFPAISFAGDGNSVTILYTGSVRGAIKPVHL